MQCCTTNSIENLRFSENTNDCKNLQFLFYVMQATTIYCKIYIYYDSIYNRVIYKTASV